MKTYGSSVVSHELNAMAWERLIYLHPDRRDELQILWTEIRQAASLILRDPELYGELMRRVRERNAEIEAEMQRLAPSPNRSTNKGTRQFKAIR